MRTSLLPISALSLIVGAGLHSPLLAQNIDNDCPHAVIEVVPPAYAAQARTFQATLNGASEQPNPVDTPGSGRASFSLIGNQLSVDIPYLGLKAPLSAAHIHGPATREQTADVLISLVPPLPALATRAGRIVGTVTVTEEQIDLLLKEATYLNLHTGAHPSGEIRGHVVRNVEPDFLVISPNNRDARVIFDGSTSWDPEGAPLSYAWYEINPPQSAAMVAEASPQASKKSSKKSSRRKPPGGPKGDPGPAACQPVAELTLRYNGDVAGAVGVVQTDLAVLYFGVLMPGDTFSFQGYGGNGDMTPRIEVFLNGSTINALFDTSGKTLLPPGTTDGKFQVVSGRTTSGSSLCTTTTPPPGPGQDCPPEKVSELTLRYIGTETMAPVGVAQKDKAVLFWQLLNPGDEFTFMGAGRNGDMSPEIGVFLGTTMNAAFDTSGNVAVRIGQTSGQFVVVSGRTLSNRDLCPPPTPPGPGQGCPPEKVSELTLRYIGTEPLAPVGVAQKDKAVLFWQLLNPGDEFTFMGAGRNGDMSPEIGVFLGTTMNAAFDTSGNVAVKVGQTSGQFVVVSGRTLNGGPLCDMGPPPGQDCPPEKVSELTLRYIGTEPMAAVGVAQKDKAVLFWQLLNPGDEFTFMGAGRNGDMSPEIGVFLGTTMNAAFDTSGNVAVRIGQTSGQFVVVSGRTLSGGPLCDLGPPPGQGCPPEKISELTLEYIGTEPMAAVGVAQTDKAVLFWQLLNPGDQFTFMGAGRNGDMSPEIGVFLGTTLNATFDTSGNVPVRIGQTSGQFVVVSGRTLSGGPLCDMGPGNGGPVRVLFGTDVVAERVLGLGLHTIELDVNDGSCTDTASARVQVLTAGQAVDFCIDLVESTVTSKTQRRQLIHLLKSAQAAFEDGNFQRGREHLRDFRSAVRDVPYLSATDRQELRACAGVIIDSL